MHPFSAVLVILERHIQQENGLIHNCIALILEVQPLTLRTLCFLTQGIIQPHRQSLILLLVILRLHHVRLQLKMIIANLLLWRFAVSGELVHVPLLSFRCS